MRKLLLFDIDKTLITSKTKTKSRFTEAIKSTYGIEGSTQQIQNQGHGMTDQEIVIEILHANKVPDKIIHTKLDLCLRWMIDNYRILSKDEFIEPLIGVSDSLEYFTQNKCLLGLVTGNLEPIAHYKLKKAGIDRFFQLGGYGNEALLRKDLVKIALQKAKDQFHYSEISNTILIGDAPQDMIAAKVNRIIPVGVLTGVYNREELLSTGAKLVINDLTNFQQILELTTT
ncbi:MAG: HAD hydrolase-like protein [bacterium]